jgi:hypothetical protein
MNYLKNLVLKSGYVKLAKSIVDEKEIGVLGFWKKFRGAREAWWEKPEKTYVGMDKFGNKYYTSSSDVEFSNFFSN